MMSMKDMVDLITVYDGYLEICDALRGIVKTFGEDGALGKLSFVSEVIARHSPIYEEEDVWEETEFGRILDNRSLSVEARAKLLLKK